MGIIKDILREEVIRNNGWVKLLKYLGPILDDVLLPHEIIGNVIQYNLDGYDKMIINGDDIISIFHLERRLDSDLCTYLKPYMMVLTDSDNNDFIWFNMKENIDHNGYISSGMFKNIFRVKNHDQIRKVYHGRKKNDNKQMFIDKDDLLVDLSTKYPDYFFRTIKTKTGFIQDKADVSLYVSEDDFDELYSNIYNIFSYYYPELSIDLHQENVGYDKDGKLKAFDI
jgi:hypothetical protein